MNSIGNKNKLRHLTTLASTAGRVCLAAAFALSIMSGVAGAAPLAATSPTLGAAGSFSVLAGTTVTCTGSTTTGGAVGVSPGTAITGFPVPCSAGGGTHSNDASAIAAQGAATAAFTALDQGCTNTFAGVQDLTLVSPLGPGVYCADAFLLTGNLTLSGSGVWIFKSASTLTTSSNSSVTGGDPCNVWWRLVSSGTLGTGTSFIGNILALASLHLQTNASLNGRALAQTAAVTLDSNTISGPSCGGASAGATPQPSYVDVSYPCSTDPSTVTVTVGLSAGVIVYGLGADITSGADTGANKIVRVLPFGHYDWHAVAPAGHYLVAVPSGVVDAFLCPSSAPGATAAPGSTGTPAASATGVPLLPATGADLAGGRALAARHLMQGSLGLLGLSLVLLGVALWRKRE